jgi:putative CocE/NonD family hydrolase
MPGRPQYPDMAANDRKALTYTTGPLRQDIEIIGHPVARVWIQSPAEDIDVFVYLEEVDPAGRSTYVTEGCLRASHRALAAAPYDRIGLPYHGSRERDAMKLSDEPAEMVFDLLPTAKRFRAGHRIRIALTCADKDSYRHLEHDPAPTLRVLRDEHHCSYIVLSVVE